jgi:hypothetical protein
MKKLYPLIPSPRAAKRFVNVYRLFRAMVDEDKLDEFVGDELQGQYQAALLLLALIIGFPGEATEILAALMEPTVQGTWWDVVDRFKERGGPSPAPSATTPAPAEQRTPEAERWQELFAKLDAIKPVLGEAVQPLEDFVHCAPHAARYSFQSGRVLLV